MAKRRGRREAREQATASRRKRRFGTTSLRPPRFMPFAPVYGAWKLDLSREWRFSDLDPEDESGSGGGGRGGDELWLGFQAKNPAVGGS